MNYQNHHIWCSIRSTPAVECKRCAKLYEVFPYKEETYQTDLAGKYLDDFTGKHFPEAIKK